MGKIPIDIKKVKQVVPGYGNSSEKDVTSYLLSIEEKGSKWTKSIITSYEDLVKFRNYLNDIISKTTTSEILNIEQEKANILDQHYDNDPLCSSCNYKLSYNCLTCIFDLQSPLERKLYLALKNEYVKFDSQYPLNWKGANISMEGKSYHNPKNNFKEVLTVVDFYIEKNGVRLCVYTDGHTYHERTEEQAQRDKRIDRKLQELGFIVLRYTGKDVNDNANLIVEEIKKWIKN